MDTTKRLRGIELRYVLTATVAKEGVMSVEDLAYELARRGFSVNGRPSKVISDALRWEVGLGRVTQCGRGNYGPGAMPRSTESKDLAEVHDPARGGRIAYGIVACR